MVLFMTYLSIGFESPMSSVFVNRTKNNQFKLTALIHFIGVVLYLAICFGTKHSELDYIPSYEIILTSVLGIVVIALLDEWAKARIQRVYQLDQQKLKIHYETKLGMWS
eukprot:CAMPEP_0116871418 /NCGR_PEP_ID=MMETSP0463-20121206/1763_1 /TAXON_ID=181622 /ORGANISM="Strombidinopsis sp, Strain SopsisLIS2011" /LENGTH=108 /DNA_ID=CAMNT_0004509809 /DNA_START=2618 /DNA_END=2941 /DNA_ORIENTATION=-